MPWKPLAGTCIRKIGECSAHSVVFDDEDDRSLGVREVASRYWAPGHGAPLDAKAVRNERPPLEANLARPIETACAESARAWLFLAVFGNSRLDSAIAARNGTAVCSSLAAINGRGS